MTRQRMDTPRAEGQEQQYTQHQGGPARAREAGASGEPARTQGSATGAMQGTAPGTAPGASTRGDQERQRELSREGGTSGRSAGMGMQPGGAGRTGAVSGPSQGRPSLLPALMASPDLMAGAFMSNPFAFAQAMSEEMERLFSANGGEVGASYAPVSQYGQGRPAGGTSRALQQQGSRGLRQWMPQMEVVERGKQLVVRADLPGLTPDDVQIDIEDGVLTLSGERRQSTEDTGEGFYRSERSYGAFARSIALPEGIDEEQVQARFEHGVLEVTVPLPQPQRSRGRRVQIQAGGGSRAASQPSGQSSGRSSSEAEQETRAR